MALATGMFLPTDAQTYAALTGQFRWHVPERYNIGWAVCGRHAHDRSRIALHFEDEDGATATYTYWDIQQQANRLSNALAAMGVKRGDRVAIMLPQRPETVVAHVACYQMGAIALPLSHLFGPDALEFRLNDASARVAIVDQDTLPKLTGIRDSIGSLARIIGTAGARGDAVESWDTLLSRAKSDFTLVDSAANDPAMIIYTSGTTGSPKGALIAHRTLIGNLPGFCCSHDFFPQAGDMFWSPADWAWTGGLFDALLPTLQFGMPLLGFRGRFDPERACALMRKYHVRNAFLFPTALKMMMKEITSPTAFESIHLRSMMSGGEAVGETVMQWTREKFGVTINEIFGQTEMNYVIGGCARVFAPRLGAMGRPYPGHRITLLDEHGSEVADGEVGEIAVHRVGDPIMFLEYWNNPESTRAKFSGDWGRTGDIAIRDDEGFYWYRGRTDDVIKSAGYRIGPSEIENCLLRHESVANAAVIGIPDPERGQAVKAFIVLTSHAKADAALERSLQEHVRQRLAPYQYPREFEFVEALPMTTTGKIQRRVLRDAQQTSAENPVATRLQPDRRD